MDFFGNRYYGLNRLTLSISGLWPYHHWVVRWIVAIVIFVTLATIILAMVCKVLTTESSLDMLSQSFQFIVPGLVFMMNLCYCFLNGAKIKMLLQHIKSDWDLFQPTDTSIILKYAEMGRIYTLVLTGLAISTPFIEFISIIMSDEWASRSETNDTHQLEIPIPVEYFIDHEKNVCYIFIHIFLAITLGMLVTAAVGSLYMCSVQHACGMFDIVGHRVETMFDNIGEDVLCNENGKIFTSIIFHSRALEFTDILNSVYGPLYLIEVGLLIVLLSSNIFRVSQFFIGIKIFRLFQAYLHADGVVICALHVGGVIVCMSIFSFTGQELLNHSSEVLIKAYASQWYVAPANMQRSLLLIMTRSLKESSIKMTRSIIVSYELLVTILQMSMSYFMAMYSLQEENN